MSWRTISATISWAETHQGWPPQLTLMPTTSEGWMNWRQASAGVFVPVSAHMPRAIISRTTSSLAALVSVSTHLSDLTAITRPGYGPGMPGAGAGLYALTMRSL